MGGEVTAFRGRQAISPGVGNDGLRHDLCFVTAITAPLQVEIMTNVAVR